MQTVTTIGFDIAKSVFQVHGVDAAGQVVIRRQLNRLEAGAGLVVMAAPASLLSPNGPPVGTPAERFNACVASTG